MSTRSHSQTQTTSETSHPSSTKRLLQRSNQQSEEINEQEKVKIPSFPGSTFNGDFSQVPVHNTPRIQPKLRLGQPGDRFEEEADKVARQVMRAPNPMTRIENSPPPGNHNYLQERLQKLELGQEIEEEHPARMLQPRMMPPGRLGDLISRHGEKLQRQEITEEDDTEEILQPKIIPGYGDKLQRQEIAEEEILQAKTADSKIGTVKPSIESNLNISRGKGQPLPKPTRDFMESRFGADFSGVRVHTDNRAVQMNKELQAQAFTYGEDIYYGAGKSPGNDELTAHELTHTIQQTGGLKLKKELKKPEEELETLQAKELSTSVGKTIDNKELQLQSTEEEAEDKKTIQPKLITNYAPKTAKGFIQSQALTVSAVTPRIQGLFDSVEDKIAEFAERIPGFSLLTLILGRNPITDEPMERNATNLIGGILDLVPNGESIFANLKESGALERAFTWFQEQMATLNITWEGIKGLFNKAYDSIGVGDIFSPSEAFEKIKNIFLPPLNRIKNFAIAVGKKVMEFVFEGVMNRLGGAGAKIMAIIKSAGESFSSIIKDPIGFVGNLVAAVKGGFSKFSANIVTHLKSGLMGWLFGTLGKAGLTLPENFDLEGILSIVLQVLNLTYDNLRTKLVEKVGEKRVARIEKGLDFLKTIITGGLGAAWEKITEFLSNLQETVIGGIREWVQNSIIKAAIVKIISMFNPAGAVIQAVMAIYNTIQFFIERGSQIAELAQAVFSSIGKIAAGDVAAAANYVEQTMAKTLPVVISFLAKLIIPGDISEKIRNIIKRIQAPINKALDRLVSFVVGKAKGLFKRKTGKGDNDKGYEKQTKIKLGLDSIDTEELKYIKDGKISNKDANKVANTVKEQNPIFKSISVIEGNGTWDYQYISRAKTKKGEPRSETPKQGDHVFNKDVKKTIETMPSIPLEILGDESKQGAKLQALLDRLNSTIDKNAFNLTVRKEGARDSGGDANSKSYGKAKQQFIQAFRRHIMNIKFQSEAKTEEDKDRAERFLRQSSLEIRFILLHRWLDSAVDEEALKLADKNEVKKGQKQIDKIRNFLAKYIP